MNYDSLADTMDHKLQVKLFMHQILNDLNERASKHDNSKMISPEKPIFDVFTPKLKYSDYGSNEYKEHLKNMKIALDHHYKENRHHPEHFKNGIKDMNLADLVELICDWKASSLRHKAGGDIMESIEINQKRFGYGDEIKQLLINTVNEYF